MGTSVLVPVGEYLNTTYRPDRDYVDGELRERNVGERPHGILQLIFGEIFGQHLEEWDVVAMGDTRVQVTSTRYRIPDVCVVRRTDPDDDIVIVPPLLCIEILSKDDSLTSLQERVDDFLTMGVENVWIVNPWTRRAHVVTTGKYEEPADGVLRIAGTKIAVRLDTLFADLDRRKTRL